MIAIERSARPCVCETSGERLSVQLMNSALRSEKSDDPFEAFMDDLTRERAIRFTCQGHDTLTSSLIAPAYGPSDARDLQREYAYDNARAAQGARLRTLEAIFDAGTIAELEARGGGGGWRCLEVGAGGGSIALWLADRVALDGAVLATDLDTTVLAGMSHPGLEVRAHDLLDDELPAGAFDLVHARMLLAWLPDPRSALARLIGALEPGGWLLVEELDFASAVPDPRMGPELAERFERMVAAHHAVIAERHGFDPHYGRRLAGDLADAGLAESGCRGRASMWRAGEPGGDIWRMSVEQLRDGVVTSAHGRRRGRPAIALCSDPRFSPARPRSSWPPRAAPRRARRRRRTARRPAWSRSTRARGSRRGCGRARRPTRPRAHARRAWARA